MGFVLDNRTSARGRAEAAALPEDFDVSAQGFANGPERWHLQFWLGWEEVTAQHRDGDSADLCLRTWPRIGPCGIWAELLPNAELAGAEEGMSRRQGSLRHSQCVLQVLSLIHI